jgi:hypothetical protein
VPLSNLPTGTVSPGESRGTRPRDGDTPTGDASSVGADADRDVYVAELEHENATLRAELDRQADPETHCDSQYTQPVSTHPKQSPQSDADVPDDSLCLRVARLLRLR